MKRICSSSTIPRSSRASTATRRPAPNRDLPAARTEPRTAGCAGHAGGPAPQRSASATNSISATTATCWCVKVIDNTTSRGRTLRSCSTALRSSSRRSSRWASAPAEMGAREVEPRGRRTLPDDLRREGGRRGGPDGQRLHFSKHLMKRMEIQGRRSGFRDAPDGAGQLPHGGGCGEDLSRSTRWIPSSSSSPAKPPGGQRHQNLRPQGRGHQHDGHAHDRNAVSTNGPGQIHGGWTNKFIFAPYGSRWPTYGDQSPALLHAADDGGGVRRSTKP